MGKKKAGKGAKDAAKAASSDSGAGACILDEFLFLGPATAASNSAFLTSNAISHVISIGHDPPTRLELRVRAPGTGLNVPPGKTLPLEYHRLRLVDSASAASSSALDTCVAQASEILERCASQRTRALVHCSAGISRSPTVLAAYLMRHRGMRLKAALYTLARARPAVSPNPHFLAWLQDEEVRIYGGEGSLAGIERLPVKTADRLALLAPGEEAAQPDESAREKVQPEETQVTPESSGAA